MERKISTRGLNKPSLAAVDGTFDLLPRSKYKAVSICDAKTLQAAQAAGAHIEVLPIHGKAIPVIFCPIDELIKISVKDG